MVLMTTSVIGVGVVVVVITGFVVGDPDFVFDMPDVVASVETHWGEVQLEAYGARQNGPLLGSISGAHGAGRVNLQSRLSWVSVGHPNFVAAEDPESGENAIFHFHPDGVYSYIQMLTPMHRTELSKAASEMYNLNIKPSQIAHLVLNKFECKLLLRKSNEKLLMIGSVVDFQSYPLRIDFLAPEGSPEREAFKERLDAGPRGRKKPRLKFSCHLTSMGRVVQTNVLIVTSSRLYDLGISERLLGSASAAFVSRHQMAKLSAELYSALNIQEEYEMPEFQFQSIFGDDLIRQATGRHFEPVTASEALKELSDFGIDLSGSLTPDEILRELSSIIEVRRESSKVHLALNEEYLNQLKDSGFFQEETDGKGAFLGIGLGGSFNFVRKKSSDWLLSSKSIIDQLRELNDFSKIDLVWAIHGSRVIPRTIKVAKITSGSFIQTLTFNRVHRKLVEAPFSRKTALYLERSTIEKNIFDELKRNLADIALEQDQHSQSLTSLSESLAATKALLLTKTQVISDHLEAKLSEQLVSITDLHSQVVQLNSVAIRQCRLCFLEDEGSSQCHGHRHACSGWSSSPSWSPGFRDDTDNRAGGCNYHWKIECIVT